MNKSEQIKTRSTNVQSAALGRAAATFGPLSRLLVVLVTASLAPNATASAQQTARAVAQTRNAARVRAAGADAIRPFQSNPKQVVEGRTLKGETV